MTTLLQAQVENTLFTPINLPQKLSEEQMTMVKKIENQENLINLTYVRIENLLNLSVKNKKYIVNFETVGIENFTVELKRTEFNGNGDYVWFGQSIDIEKSGHISLIKKGKNVFGTIVYKNRYFQIYGIDEKISALLEFKPTTEETICKPAQADKKLKKDNNTIRTSTGNLYPETINPCEDIAGVTIVIFFTSEAAAITPDLYQFASSCVEEFNGALSNSDIATYGGEYRYVSLRGAEVLPSPVLQMETEDDDDDLTTFANSWAVENRRQELKADIKFMITRGHKYPSNYNGISTWRAETAESAYGSCKKQKAIGGGQRTFVHEVGHIYGAQHNFEGNRPDIRDIPQYAHGIIKPVTYNYGLFNLGTKRKAYATIMVDNRQNNGSDFTLSGLNFQWENALYFSNPDVSVFGHSLGNEFCNNAKIIKERTQLIRSFTTVTDNFNASMSGPYSMNEYETHLFQSHIYCGKAPFTSRWEVIGSDGTPYYDVILPNDGSFTINSGEFIGQSWIILRLTVRSSDGQERIDSRYIAIWSSEYYQSVSSTENKERVLAKNNIELMYPNPTSDKLMLNVASEENINYQILIYNSQGNLVKQEIIETNDTKKSFKQTIDVSQLANGIYFVHIANGKKTQTKKIIINH